jgi:uncharacterized protein YidB (DUF937 family)
MSINIGDLLGQLAGGGNQQQQQQQPASGGGGQGNLMASLLPVVLPMLANGGLQKILGGLQSKGLTEQVDSWKADGSNEPVSPAQIKEVMDDDTLAQIAQKAGVSQDQAAAAISQVLPGLVDGVSHGNLQAEAEKIQAEAPQEKKDDDGGFDLGGMIGSLSKQLGL